MNMGHEEIMPVCFVNVPSAPFHVGVLPSLSSRYYDVASATYTNINQYIGQEQLLCSNGDACHRCYEQTNPFRVTNDMQFRSIGVSSVDLFRAKYPRQVNKIIFKYSGEKTVREVREHSLFPDTRSSQAGVDVMCKHVRVLHWLHAIWTCDGWSYRATH